jgi:ArsR family transcriptional regulator, arsenate/arsenite/antimonite-responsive transcriptional repressor
LSITLAVDIDICQYVGMGSPPTTRQLTAGCFTNISQSPLSRGDADELARLLKAVADPVRLQLLSIIGTAKGGESCVCDLTALVGLSQPTVSHHLKILTDTGILTRERRGPWAWFTLVPERLGEVVRILC